jgi:hypothetical protein
VALRRPGGAGHRRGGVAVYARHYTDLLEGFTDDDVPSFVVEDFESYTGLSSPTWASRGGGDDRRRRRPVDRSCPTPRSC